jgi:hypothetical protein
VKRFIINTQYTIEEVLSAPADACQLPLMPGREGKMKNEKIFTVNPKTRIIQKKGKKTVLKEK